MRQITRTVYTFDELNDKAKQRAIKNFADSGEEMFLEEDMKYKLYELLDAAKIKCDGTPTVFYSLGYSQGDGAMFAGHFDWKHYAVYISQSGRYYHYNSKEIEVDGSNGKPASEKVWNEFNDLYVDICRKLERYGYNLIEEATSDEAITDMIKANDYEFYETGELI